MGMTSRLMKSFAVAAFSIFSLIVSLQAVASGGGEENDSTKKKSFNAQEVIFGHILDGHEFHFFDIIHDDGTHTPVGIPLPVILYSPQKGFDVFMSSKFHHGHEIMKDTVTTEERLKKLEEKGIEVKKEGLKLVKSLPVGADGKMG